jgi:hypothetical protein
MRADRNFEIFVLCTNSSRLHTKLTDSAATGDWA